MFAWPASSTSCRAGRTRTTSGRFNAHRPLGHRLTGRVAHRCRRPDRPRRGAVVRDGDVAEVERLTQYDDYYYARRNDRPLPVLRLRFDDPDGTTLYINPETATIESRIDHSGRWRRWLYNGLHSLDFPLLWERRPLWDVVVLGLSLAGLAFSLTGAVIGWKRLTGRVRVKRRH